MELSLQLDVAGKLIYLLSATVMLFIVLYQLKCCCRRNTRVDGHAHNTGRVNHNVSGEVGINVTLDDEASNREIAMSQTSLAATIAFLFN